MYQSSHYRLVPRIEGLINRILKAAHYGGMALTVAMMLLTVVHGIGRYVFGTPIPGLVELSSFMLVSMVFLIGAYTMVEKQHIVIGVIVDRFSPRTQAIFDSVTYLLCLLFAILALWQSFVRGIVLQNTTQASAILHIPIFPFVYIVGVGWALLALSTLIHVVHFLLGIVKK